MKIPPIINIGKYTFIYKGEMTDEDWLDSRKDGVGGSDLSVLLNVNPWSCAARVFFEKLDMVEPANLDENEAVYWGKVDEDIILEASKHYDYNDPKAYMVNHLIRKTPLRSHIPFPFIIIHNDIPWLRMNIDGIIFNDVNVTEEKVIADMLKGILPRPDGIAEIKTIRGKSRDRWRGGVPHGYILQTQGYITVGLGMNPDLYAVIFSRVDGAELTHHLVEFDERLMEKIVKSSYEFWQRVLTGKEIVADETLTHEQKMEQLWKIAPEADSTEDYNKFLSESYLWKLNNPAIVVEDDEYIEANQLYDSYASQLNELTAMKQFMMNKMKQKMALVGSNKLTFKKGDLAVGTAIFNRRFYNKKFDI